MFTLRLIAVVLVAAVLYVAPALAAKPDSYQVTGAVVELGNDKIVVMKGKERFEIARDGTTKMPGEVKVGDKVTVYYRMTATEVESKGAAKAPKTDAKTKTKNAA
jgi:hypothetical protein